MRLARSNAARRAIALRHCAERLREKNSHKAQTKANSVYEERAAAGRHSGYQLPPIGGQPRHTRRVLIYAQIAAGYALTLRLRYGYAQSLWNVPARYLTLTTPRIAS